MGGKVGQVMSQHLHDKVYDWCYRCQLGLDELAELNAEIAADFEGLVRILWFSFECDESYAREVAKKIVDDGWEK